MHQKIKNYEIHLIKSFFISTMGSEQSNQSSMKWQKTFEDCSIQLNIPGNKDSKAAIELLQKMTKNTNISDFSKIDEILNAKVPTILEFYYKDLTPSYSSKDIYSLCNVFKRMKGLPQPSIHLIGFHENEETTKKWRNFYLKAFLDETIKRHADFKFISKYNASGMVLMLTEINLDFMNVRDFVFATGNLNAIDAAHVLENCSDILEKSADSLENFCLLYRNTGLLLSRCNRIYEKLYYGVFPKLKSLRFAFGSEMLLQSTHERIIALESLSSLRDFGFFWANPSINLHNAKKGVELISKIMVQIDSIKKL